MMQFQQLCQFLEQQNWDYQADAQRQQLQVQRQGLTVLISLEEDGEFVKMVLPQLLTLPSDHPHYEAALECLLHLGWRYKLVRWQRDPRDGEVRVQADLPLEDGELSSRQFWRTLQGCLQIAQEGREQVQQVLQTGTVASKTDALPLLRILLQAEVSGGAEAVYGELDQRGGGVDPNLAEAAQQFLRQAAESADQEMLDGLVGVIGNLAIRLQDYPRGRREQNVAMAILLYEIVLDARPYDRLPDEWAQTQNNLGSAYSDLPTGDRAENLQQAITCYTNALRFRTPERAPLDWAMTQNNLGNAYKNLPTGDRAENLQQAIGCYHDALSVRTPQLFPLDCLQTARNWGNLEFGEGNWQQALTQYQTAIEAIEQSRRFALSEERRQQIVQESIYVYENAIQAAINLQDFSSALEIVERVRAKRLVDLMATADLYQKGEIPAAVQDWLDQLDQLDQEIAHRRQNVASTSTETPEEPSSPDGQPEKRLSRQVRAAMAATEEIQGLEQQKQAILDQLSNLDEVVATLREVQPPKLQEFQPLLSENSALVSFYTTDDDTHLLILRSGESQPRCFTCQGQGYKSLQLWLRETWAVLYLQDKTQWLAQMPDTLGELAQRLRLDDLIEEHLQGIEELVLVPHLFLHQIPFAALPLKQGYLGDRFRLRYAPSLQVLGFCQRRELVSQRQYGTVENATDDLPFSSFEGATVAHLFEIESQRRLIGAQAKTTAYRHLLQGSNCLVSSHHAQSRWDNPLESGLKLSDGTITVSQLFSPAWRFPELEEVYLSCCETGLFLPKSALDEPVAVSTGFLCAGARGVIASQWSIYDLSAALLSGLYHQQRHRGLSRVVALQRAQRLMREMTGEEFEEGYAEELRELLEAELDRLADLPDSDPKLITKLMTRAEDAMSWIDELLEKEYPFEHPVHWAGLGCYGLG